MSIKNKIKEIRNMNQINVANTKPEEETDYVSSWLKVLF